MSDLGASVTLPADPASAGAARRFVVERLVDVDDDSVEAAALLTTELATNAILHAATDFAVSVTVTTDHDRVRIELTDASPVLPVRRHFSTAAGTGRGLQLVEALAVRWGVEPTGPGKTVFFEVDTTAAGAVPVIDVDLELDLDDWPELTVVPPAPNDGLVTVCIIGLPLAIEHRSAEHYAELFREFALVAERQPELRAGVPGRLLALVDELNSEFSGFTTSQQAELAAARARGETVTDLEYQVPAAVGAAAARLDALLDAADEFCRSGDTLLTLAAPPDVVRYRRWYCGQFVDQCAGSQPTAWRPS
ncbi:MAG: hypothetical protein NVS1B12_07080 [Acidimicrobiales bacterium]